METSTLTMLVALVFVAGVGYLTRSLLGRGRRDSLERDVGVVIDRLRGVNKMLLANLSLPYIAQEIVNQLPDQRHVLGGTLRTIDEQTGALTAVAVSESLESRSAHTGMFRLKRTPVTPGALQATRSSLVQALEQRRVIAGTKLADFECPPLSAAAAKAAQAKTGIAGVAVYPIVMGERLGGALTFYLSRPFADLSRTDLELLQGVVDATAIALENDRLLGEVDTVNRKLSETNVELRTANETKDEFVSIASHQLRSPLTAIKGYLSMLTDGDFGQPPAKQRPVLEQVVESTNEVINILNDMLSVSRMNAQRFELTPGAVRLEEIVTDVVDEFRPLAHKKGLSLESELPERPLGVLNLDGSRIRQAIVNYVDNAIKYTRTGRVRVRLAQDGDEAVLTVADTGIGIAPADVKRMFTKFYRTAGARELVSSGTGLGLYVAKRIITEHRGTPIVESVKGRGSTFGFRLPLPSPQPAERAKQSAK